MRKIIYLLIVILSFNSCNTDDENSSDNNSQLIIGLWEFETINGDPFPFHPADIGIVHEYEFKSNGEFISYTNGNVGEEDTWSLNSDNTIVTFLNISYTILDLNNNSMILLIPNSNPNYSFEHAFSRVE